MDRIKARQQKYKKGKERVLSMNQETSDVQAIEKAPEEDDDGTIPSIYPVLVLIAWTLAISTRMCVGNYYMQSSHSKKGPDHSLILCIFMQK